MPFYRREALINKEEYDEYIRRYSPKKLDKLIDELDEDDCPLECYTIGLSNSHSCYYDQLWLFPIGDDLIPVLITDINTSSGMAMWSCGIYRDEDEGEDNTLSLDDLIEFVGKGWRKGLKKVITENYLK